MAEANVLTGREVMLLAMEGAAAGLNELADVIYDMSQLEVPRSDEPDGRYEQTLGESGRSPRTDPELAATPGKLVSTVAYEQAYAHSQHEGAATMNRQSGPVEWEVTQYTTPGTKSKYLEDPLKAATGTAETVVGVAVRARIGG